MGGGGFIKSNFVAEIYPFIILRKYHRTNVSLTGAMQDSALSKSLQRDIEYTIPWVNMKTGRNDVDIIIVAKFQVRSQ